MSDIEVGSKRSNEYDEYGEISTFKKSRTENMKLRFLLVGRFCGAIIGKGGENIKRLRKEQSVQVNMPDTRSNDRVLTLTGARDNCINVLKEILPVCAEAPYPVNPKEKCAFELNFLVQSDQVGSVIGKGGSKIKEIRNESNGKVKVYQDCLPNSNERIVAIGGTDEERVLAAFNIVLDTLDEHPRKSQVIYYDPKNKYDGHGDDQMGGSGHQLGMGGGGGGGRGGGGGGGGGFGGALGALGGLGGLGGLGLAGAASLLGQLGVGAQGGGILGAAGALGNMWGNDNRNEGILGSGGARGGGFGGDQSGGFGMNRNHSPPRGGRGGEEYNRQAQYEGESRQASIYGASGGKKDYREPFQRDSRAGERGTISNSFDNKSENTPNIPDRGFGSFPRYEDGYAAGDSANRSRTLQSNHGITDDRQHFSSHSNSRANEEQTQMGFQAGQHYNGPNSRGNNNRDQRNGGEFDERSQIEFGEMKTVTKVTVLNDMCGAIIGKGGQRIKDIRQTSGARVDFTETEKGSKEDRVITITGTQQQIVIAQQMMAQCVRNRTY